MPRRLPIFGARCVLVDHQLFAFTKLLADAGDVLLAEVLVVGLTLGFYVGVWIEEDQNFGLLLGGEEEFLWAAEVRGGVLDFVGVGVDG
jgi:hypothetical protein